MRDVNFRPKANMKMPFRAVRLDKITKGLVVLGEERGPRTQPGVVGCLLREVMKETSERNWNQSGRRCSVLRKEAG